MTDGLHRSTSLLYFKGAHLSSVELTGLDCQRPRFCYSWCSPMMSLIEKTFIRACADGTRSSTATSSH